MSKHLGYPPQKKKKKFEFFFFKWGTYIVSKEQKNFVERIQFIL